MLLLFLLRHYTYAAIKCNHMHSTLDVQLVCPFVVPTMRYFTFTSHLLFFLATVLYTCHAAPLAARSGSPEPHPQSPQSAQSPQSFERDPRRTLPQSSLPSQTPSPSSQSIQLPADSGPRDPVVGYHMEKYRANTHNAVAYNIGAVYAATSKQRRYYKKKAERATKQGNRHYGVVSRVREVVPLLPLEPPPSALLEAERAFSAALREGHRCNAKAHTYAHKKTSKLNPFERAYHQFLWKHHFKQTKYDWKI